jgi:hypothetical protein
MIVMPDRKNQLSTTASSQQEIAAPLRARNDGSDFEPMLLIQQGSCQSWSDGS